MIIQNTTPFRKLLWYKQVLGEHIPPVEKTVSGAIIHVTDALAKPVKNLTVSIEPVQAGSGEPSPTNVRPITGWTGCNVYRSGADTSEPTTYPISFGEAGTVYGGTLDVTTGVLTVTHEIIDLGTQSWNYQAASSVFSTNISTMQAASETTNNEIICSEYANSNASRIEEIQNASVWAKAYAFTSRNVVIKDTNYTDAATFKTALSGVMLVYPLNTPTTYNLTPQEIVMLRGENCIWADTGDSELTYLAKA